MLVACGSKRTLSPALSRSTGRGSKRRAASLGLLKHALRICSRPEKCPDDLHAERADVHSTAARSLARADCSIWRTRCLERPNRAPTCSYVAGPLVDASSEI